MRNHTKCRIVLISPKGPLYRHRGGIFRQSLRYMPLTLPTLKALVPPEINATVQCIDEGIADVDLNLRVDLIGSRTRSRSRRWSPTSAGNAPAGPSSSTST
jgi:hypothetical protein